MLSPITSVLNSLAKPRPDGGAPSAGKRYGRQVAQYVERFAPLLAFIGLVIAWEAACRFFMIPTFLLPAPTAIISGATAQPLISWVSHTWATLHVALLGYATAIIISVPLAIALASSKIMSRTLYPLIVLVHAIPIVAVAPIIVVTLGISDLSRIAITFLISFFPLVVSTTTGLLGTPPELIELSRSLRAGGARELLDIRIPYAVPYLFNAMRISITLSFVGAVVAEFVASEEGLGHFIYFATSLLKIDQAFVALIILIGMSLLSFQVVTLMQRVVAPWSVP